MRRTVWGRGSTIGFMNRHGNKALLSWAESKRKRDGFAIHASAEDIYPITVLRKLHLVLSSAKQVILNDQHQITPQRKPCLHLEHVQQSQTVHNLLHTVGTAREAGEQEGKWAEVGAHSQVSRGDLGYTLLKERCVPTVGSGITPPNSARPCTKI